MEKRSFLLKAAVWMCVLALVFSVAGCARDDTSNGEEPEERDGVYGGILKIATPGDVADYDPALYTGVLHIPTLALIYDTLIRIDENDKPQPGLARDWEYLDELTLRLYLEEGVVFHDGTELNAEVVKFNIERMNSEESRVAFLRSVSAIEIVNDYTVDLKLSAPDAALLHALAAQGGMMVSPEAVEKYGEDFNSNPVGAGPFRFVSHEPLHQVVLEKYEDYWKEGLPYLDGIVLTVMTDPSTRTSSLEVGDVHIADVPVEQRAILEAREVEGIVFSQRGALQLGIIALNTEMPPFDDARVRKAFSLAINRTDLVAIARGLALPTVQFYPAGHWTHNPDVKPVYDPERAKQLLADGGYEGLKVEVYTMPAPVLVQLAELMAEMLGDIGVELEIKVQDLMTNVQAFEHEKRIPMYFTVHPGSPHPLLAYDRLLNRLNPGGWTTPEIDQLLQTARTALDIEVQQEAHREIARIQFEEQGNIIPLWSPISTGAYLESVKGLQIDFSMLGVNYMFAWLEE